MPTTHHEQLREAAAGQNPRMAATELLIRAAGGRFADPGNPWVVLDGIFGKHWIDFRQIPDNIGALSGGERRMLMLAASIADVGVEVNVGDLLAGLDLEILELVLAAVAYSGGGSSPHPRVIDNGDGTVSLKMMPNPFPWPGG